ncbi:hypothetical protein CMI47_08695 [Candidatus Pacearchaeota archaeon]|nr:hypothetical protein [Candidatus Pacearchaeota archaeon]|tara:strand:- start:67 stop:285 length:219 start_codon:yes stop_codon:yes gene_type:complete
MLGIFKKNRELEKHVHKLEDEISRLQDENDSLWKMLEEMRASDVANFTEALQKAHRELQIEKLLEGPVAGEA